MLFDSLSAVYSLPVEKLRSRTNLKPTKSYSRTVPTYDALLAHSPLCIKAILQLKKCGGYMVMLVNVSPQS